MKGMGFRSQITFLYYEDLEAAFYEDVLNLEIAADQGFAKIYRTAGNAFLGIVDSSHGYHQPQPKNAIVVSFTVAELSSWFEALLDRGVKIIKEPVEHDLVQVRSFFFKDPGGYTLEIQQFLKPEHIAIFNS